MLHEVIFILSAPLVGSAFADKPCPAAQPAVQVYRHGRGLVVQLADNPNFRSFWFGTSKLFLNGIFLSDLVDRTSPPATWLQD